MFISKKAKILGIIAFSLTLTHVYSQEKVDETEIIEDFEGEEALAQAAQNPVGDLISVPFQNNPNFGIGPYLHSFFIFSFFV